jgi:hypothetical protein
MAISEEFLAFSAQAAEVKRPHRNVGASQVFILASRF